MKIYPFYQRILPYLAIGIMLILCLSAGCTKNETAVAETSPTPVAEEQPAVVSFLVESTPVLTASPVPTPEPTPEPTPTPVPSPTMDPNGTATMNLLMDMEEIRLIGSKRGTLVYEAPSLKADKHNIKNTETDTQKSDFIVLDEVTSEDGTPFYYVEAAFNGERGYIPKEFEKESTLAAEGLTGYGILNRPRTPVYKSWYFSQTSKKIRDYRTYCAVRVLGSWSSRAFVVTEDGLFGYVFKSQICYLTRDEMEQYLIEKQENEKISGLYTTEAFLSAATEQVGTVQESTEDWLVGILNDCGLTFNPGYYFHFRKIFTDELYPDGFYRDEKYNSLMFKLRNSAGDMVSCNGEETEWSYIGDYADVEPGDILFFATYNKGEKAVIPEVEVVFYGKHSGYVTKCGIALGNNRMLTVEGGQVIVVEDITATDYFAYFDCARRIHPTVINPVAHLSECQISAIYDRLGTPYSNAQRLGDRSYDCSGIVSWSFDVIGARRQRQDKEGFTESTAAGLTHIPFIYYKEVKYTMSYINPQAQQTEDIEKLQRGDYVFLLNSSKTHIGHVMIYLGNNTVIHSTTINSKYRGTLVAQFRPALQKLYTCAVRIDTPTK